MYFLGWKNDIVEIMEDIFESQPESIELWRMKSPQTASFLIRAQLDYVHDQTAENWSKNPQNPKKNLHQGGCSIDAISYRRIYWQASVHAY